MKTAVRETSIDAYYARVVSSGVELTQIDEIVAYVVTHPCCTRRQIAAYFFSIGHHHPLAQEARVAARVNAALKRRVGGQPLIVESPSQVTDAVTGEKAYPLYPSNYGRQGALFGAAA